MKKSLLLAAIVFTINQIVYSQITNTFPLDDSVGIGTTTPFALFEIVGGDARINEANIGEGPANVNGVGIGNNVLKSNISGTRNIAIGQDVLKNNLSGSNNIGIGGSSLLANVSGFNNTAVGSYSLSNNLTGYYNCAFGSQTLSDNTTGKENTALGFYSLIFNTIGNYNVAVGTYALYSNNKGSDNTAIGYKGMFYIEKGMNNTACGAYAFDTPTKGSNNTALGYNTDMTSNFNNATAIGAEALVDASNKVRIGNSSVTSNGGQVNWTAYSDARIKRNIKENVPGLEFISLLKPVTYHFDVNKQNEIMGVRNAEPVEGMYDIEKIQWTGFIAQDVEAAAKKINYDFSGVDYSGEIMGLRYSEFVVPLVKAVQELSERNEKLETVNSNQSSEIETLEKRISKLEKLISKQGITLTESSSVYQEIKIPVSEQTASLSQNIPNPFTGKTTIAYYIPETVQNAFIKISNATGVTLFTADVKIGNGILEIDATQLSAGTYSYTLIVDGKIIDTKLMVISR